MIVSRPVATRVLYRSKALAPDRTGTTFEISASQAGWRFVHFAVRQVAPERPFTGNTGREECCLVLLRGHCRIRFDGGTAVLGPRRDVFDSYPHAIYLPPGIKFVIEADRPTEMADGRAPVPRGMRLEARVIKPEECGFEIRGGGNATRQIVDVIRPDFPAARLMVCEVFTPAGNWSSYPPHKHDVDRPPGEVKLEEIYYYRFQPADVSRQSSEGANLSRRSSEEADSSRRSSEGAKADAFGIQRIYDDRADRAMTVRHGDVALIRSGYHPFVAAYGYNAYYLNVLAGTRRSMAASDDPRYAAFRAWPAPDARLPIVPRPAAITSSAGQAKER
ncbi:MAG TPA: 5-deoxy-glucuronate isomerase [Vicinamibacterales bacterium]|nr:5-deoxy-glucuronate isomerase [Vicinamibacterales bacterium]